MRLTLGLQRMVDKVEEFDDNFLDIFNENGINL